MLSKDELMKNKITVDSKVAELRDVVKRWERAAAAGGVLPHEHEIQEVESMIRELSLKSKKIERELSIQKQARLDDLNHWIVQAAKKTMSPDEFRNLVDLAKHMMDQKSHGVYDPTGDWTST